MAKKLNIMSLSIEPGMQDFLKQKAKEEGISVSKLLRNLIADNLMKDEDEDSSPTPTPVSDPDKKVTIVEHSDEYIPVVLKIPSELRGTEKVKEWLQLRTNAIGNKLAE